MGRLLRRRSTDAALPIQLRLVTKVLVLYLERPRAKSWELRRCGGALQIQRLEGSRPGVQVGFQEVIDCFWITGKPSMIQRARGGRQFSGRATLEEARSCELLLQNDLFLKHQ
jgi:hypothetical protein